MEDGTDIEHTLWVVPFKNRRVEAFVVRELTNDDEVEAARVAKTKGPFVSPEEVSRAVFAEEVAVSIVAIRRPGGELVQLVGPCSEFHSWPSRLRLLAMHAYRQLNGIEDAEMAVFRGAAQPWTPTATATP